jgi:hypothetical protein
MAWVFAGVLGLAAAPLEGATGTVAVLIRDVPHVRQKPDFCGEACAEMALRKLGYAVTQDDVFNVSGLDPALGRGCYTRELEAALQKIGFDTGTVQTSVAAGQRADLERAFAALRADLAAGHPSIVCMRTGSGPDATEHFRLVLGHDPGRDEVIFHDPACEDGAYQRMKRGEFLDCWPLKYRADRWTVIRLRLKPRAIAWSAPARAGFSNADYAQHILALRKRVPARGFTVLLERPFVVIGDEDPRVVAARAEQTVRWATTRLKAAYFAKDPADIIDIWLFRDKASYEKHTRAIFGDEPTTPFGYSSREHKALSMNIGTGGGTLVHEMVHPFMAANFPACPAWFNEGLASLYEQSAGKGEGIVGLTNWRLAGLQNAIKAKSLPTLERLTGTTAAQFYGEDSGSNYAQARYLCYYLQEKGLLQTYYRRFTAAATNDPGGYATLQSVLGERDMAGFQKKWEAFVLGLRFP